MSHDAFTDTTTPLTVDPSQEWFTVIRRELFTAVVGDVMDRMGLLHRFLPAAIKPIDPAMVVVGRAMPVLEVDVFDEGSGVLGSASGVLDHNGVMGGPFGVMFEALDSLQPDEVYVCTGVA